MDILQNFLRMLQPVMPFICEEIWQILRDFFPDLEESVIIAVFPKPDNSLIDKKIDEEMLLIQETITAIRNLRKQVNLAPGLEVDVLIKVSEKTQKELLKSYLGYLQKLAKVKNARIGIDIEKPESTIAEVVQNIEVYLPLKGLIDVEEEIQMEKLEKELQKITGELINDKFLEKAPESIIKKEREKHEEVKTKLDKTKEILRGLL